MTKEDFDKLDNDLADVVIKIWDQAHSGGDRFLLGVKMLRMLRGIVAFGILTAAEDCRIASEDEARLTENEEDNDFFLQHLGASEKLGELHQRLLVDAEKMKTGKWQ